MLPKFNIFSGRFSETGVLWIECVEELGAAVDRMKALAAENPGPYFILHVDSRRPLASIDTGLKGKAGAARNFTVPTNKT